MSIFTIAIIIWVVYQLGVSVLKKGQKTPGNPSGPLKMPDGRPVGETVQGPSKPQGSWLDQIQHAMHESARKMEERVTQAEPLRTTESNDSVDDYVQTEQTKQTEHTQGLGGTTPFERLYTTELISVAEETPPEIIPRVSPAMIGNSFFMTKENLTQGIIWAEVLGKPRAMHPFRGPR